MDLTREGLCLAAFVLLPGFAFYSVSRSFQPPEARKPGELEMLLHSLAVTSLLLGVEAVVLLLLIPLVEPVRHDVEFLLKNGIDDYVQRNALALPYTLGSIGFANMVVMTAAGWFQVPQKIVRRAQLRQGLSEWNTWYRVLWIGPDDSGDRRRMAGLPLGVRVRLKEGGVYHGALAAFSLCGNDGERDLAIWDACYSPTEPADLKAVNPEGQSAVIIPAAQIESIEVFYPDLSGLPPAHG